MGSYSNEVKIILMLKLLNQLVQKLSTQPMEKVKSDEDFQMEKYISNNIDHNSDIINIENDMNNCEHIQACECATEFCDELKSGDDINKESNDIIEFNEEHIHINPINKILHILKIRGLIKVDIYFMDGKETRENVNIVSVNKCFVEIFDPASEENIIIPTDKISIVRSKSGLTPSIPDSALIELEAQECNYCELTLEEYFKNNIGNKIVVQTVNNLSSEKNEITAVGKGIVILNGDLAVSISKIRAIKIEPQV